MSLGVRIVHLFSQVCIILNMLLSGFDTLQPFQLKTALLALDVRLVKVLEREWGVQPAFIPQNAGLDRHSWAPPTVKSMPCLSVRVYVSTIPTAEVASTLSQHGCIRVMLWGLLFPVSEHCAENFIMFLVLLLGCLSLPWLSAPDFLLHVDVPSFAWLVLRAGAVWEAVLDRSLNGFFPCFSCVWVENNAFEIAWKI